METIENTIVAFHIGRGGRFNNQGFKKFLGEGQIKLFINDLFTAYEYESKLSDIIGNRSNLREKFESCRCNDDFTFFEEKFKYNMGQKIYLDCSGEPVGLSQSDVDCGIGTIDHDGDYDTTYTCKLAYCNEEELMLIVNSNHWNEDVVDYAKDKLS